MGADLFDAAAAQPGDVLSAGGRGRAGAPLAERMRPGTVADVIGQRHLLGPGRPLAAALASGKPHSMILWGPPGVGKTTLARLLAGAFEHEFVAISAVLGGVKDIREAVERAQMSLARGRRTIVFVDEVHRFNKAQQDAFLPHVESGLLTFIGATTENPSFEVNGALLSRATVHVLEKLDATALGELALRACERELGAARLDADAASLLVDAADGDARRMLNVLEQAALLAGAADVAGVGIGLDAVKNALGTRVRRFDKGGDAFYDQISALHKSMRGSHPNAALYWLVRMLDGGADPRYLARRIVRMAIEDVGLADARALRLALDAAEVYERLGSPEGELALAQAIVYLAACPKSNAVYAAYNAARKYVEEHPSDDVPVHLRNAPTALMKSLGHGRDYRYAHDETQGYAAGEQYMPQGRAEPEFYVPTDRGLEARIGERMAWLRGLDAAAGDESTR